MKKSTFLRIGAWTLLLVFVALPLFAAVTQIDLTSQVKGILPHGNGGTDSAYFSVAGPTATRIYTFPDAAATIMSTTTGVTASQLPNPTSSSLGGVESKDCTGSGHIVKIGTDGVPTCASDATGPTFTDNETPSGTIDGSNATFTTAVSCTGLHLYKNGQRMTPGASADYTYSGSTITFATGAKPKSGDVLSDDCRQ